MVVLVEIADGAGADPGAGGDAPRAGSPGDPPSESAARPALARLSRGRQFMFILRSPFTPTP